MKNATEDDVRHVISTLMVENVLQIHHEKQFDLRVRT